MDTSHSEWAAYLDGSADLWQNHYDQPICHPIIRQSVMRYPEHGLSCLMVSRSSQVSHNIYVWLCITLHRPTTQS